MSDTGAIAKEKVVSGDHVASVLSAALEEGQGLP